MRWQRWLKLSLILCLLLLVVALVLPAIQVAREAARRAQSKVNMRQFGLALQNYHDTHGSLPPGGIIREDGTAMNGWITMIRPYFDASPDYSMLDLDESWESPRNVYIFERTFHYALNPSMKEHYTASGYGLTHYLGNPNLLYRNSSVQFDQIQNGTAHTWMAGEVAGNFQPWSYPFNWRALGTKLCTGPGSFGCPIWLGGHLLMGDGSILFYSEETSPEILSRLANAPPIATTEQTIAPAKIFESFDAHWERTNLQSDQLTKSRYYMNVLYSEAGETLIVRVFTYETVELTEEEKSLPILDFTPPYLILQIDSTTDIPQALKSTSMFKTVSPEQFQENVKVLQAIQTQLQ